MKKKILILSLIVMLITCALSVSVFATDDEESEGSGHNFTLVMNAKSSKVTPGGEVLITVKISNLNVGSSGIGQIRAILGYDTDVFETLTESSIDGIDGWKPSFAVGTNKVQLYRDKPLKTDGEIMQISLKTKAGVAEGTQGEVSITSIIASDSVNEYGTSNVSTSITVTNNTGGIGSENAAEPTNTQTPIPLNITVEEPKENNTVNEAPVNNTQNNTTNEIQVVNETDQDIPYTGSDSGALARIIIGVIFISLVIYIKLERMNKEIK